MGTITPVKLKLGKLDAGGENYPLTLSWVEGDATKSVEETVPKDLKVTGYEADDYTTYRNTFMAGGEKQAFRRIGLHLHAVLHKGSVGEKLSELKTSEAAGESLRTLLDIEPQDLALLPWELMFDGRERPFQDTKDTIVRVSNYGENASPRAEAVNWPLRLLIVVGVDDDNIGAREEIENIEDTLRKVRWLVDVEVRERPDINELEKMCRETFRPHVFHYIGHGGMSRAGDPYVMLESPGGGPATWTAGEIKSSLEAWGWAPRFAFLNACRTAVRDDSVENQKSAWDVGGAFRSVGVSAVLTMQADVKGSLAGIFAGALYESLASGASVVNAVANARIKMRNNTTALNRDHMRDWATPTLLLSCPPEEVLPPTLRPRCVGRDEQEIEQDIARCKEFQAVSVLADRRSDRRLFIHGLYPIPPQQPNKELIFVHGSKQIGKTWMTLWCLESYARRGHDVRYVEVAGADSAKWLDVLMHIQTGDPSKTFAGQPPLIFRPLSPKAFNEFNHELSYHLRNAKPPDWTGQDVPPPSDADTSGLDNLPGKTVEEIFKSFRTALVAAAELDNPLVIVLDKFTYERSGLTESHFNKFLMPFLFEPAAGGDLKTREGDRTRSVKLVLVMNDEELDLFTKDNDAKDKMDLLKNYAHEVRLEGIPVEDFEQVAMEFFRNLKAAPQQVQGKLSNSTKEDAESVIERLRVRLPKKTWPPYVLDKMRAALEKIAEVEV